MKTITYTQMRSNLSDTLDLLRSGENVTITQRGKPDLIIHALESNDSLALKDINPIKSAQNNDVVNNYIAQEFLKKPDELKKQIDGILCSKEVVAAMQQAAAIASTMHNVSESFARALIHTRTKHAEIIKKLEDK
ncbi:type II toxin-antitoxin system Phd/YefM family antitoxin [Pantoea ananatis]|uniref:type II toxin-antitoxin system Phd/YefM family antitoxin n=1 Tax=Pantoea ananas TaxID=553 RepID=UPI003C146611